MRTTQTSWPFTGTAREALFDEIVKLSSEAPAQLPQKPAGARWKRVAKVGLAAGAGYVAGHVGAMAVDAGLKKVFKNKYPNWSPGFKKKVLFPLLGLAMVGMTVGNQIANDRRARGIEGHE
jgi:hypothetical protein